MKPNTLFSLGLLLLVCLSTPLLAQLRLDVEGNSRFRGHIDAAAASDPSSLFIGQYAGLNDDQTNNHNSFIGYYAGYSNTTGSNNTATGSETFVYNTTGSDNTAYGALALQFSQTGSFNTALGSSAMRVNSSGSQNTAVGFGALRSNTTGGENTAMGYRALYSSTEGTYNTAVGYQTLYLSTLSGYNTAVGYQALYNTNGGNTNTGIGYQALVGNTTGFLNTATGYYALGGNSTGYYNTGYGTGSNVSANNLDYASAFGAFAVSNANNKTVIGRNVAGTVIGGFVNWSNLSDGRFKEDVKENVPGLDFIRQLRPVTYWINVDKLQRHITAQMPDSVTAFYLPTAEEQALAKQEIRTGFIAQEVEAVAKRIGYTFDGVNAPKNPTDNYSIAYGQFVPSLVKGMQEQQEEIEKQEAEMQKLRLTNAELRTEIDDLRTRLAKLEALLQPAAIHTQQPAHLSSARLDQNQPNPSDGSTLIRYFIPPTVSKAELRITSVDGKVVETISLPTRGEGQTDVQLQNLNGGNYFYTLVLDGQILETKQMMILKN